MKWANFLHIYQPADQQPDILEAVVAQSYRPLLNGIKENPKVRLTLNVNGALIELFDKHNHRDIIDFLRLLGKNGQLEFTSSAKYHAVLPFLKNDEITRQIQINDETNRFFLGDAYKPEGFFPPEMIYKNELASIVSELGFRWIILDEIAHSGGVEKVDYSKVYKIKGTKLKVFFRERRLSNLIMSAVVRSRETLLGAMKDELGASRYVVTAMDGETFGHHRPGLEKLLLEIFKTPEFELIQISDVSKYFKKTETILPIMSTWASSKQDIDRGVQFLSWSDPDNIIHRWQWDFVKLALEEVYRVDKNSPEFAFIRDQMDRGLASDHFWWASAKPWWSLEMIEDGAYRLLSTIRAIPNVASETMEKARDYYEKIVSTAFNWQRTGHVRKLAQEQKQITRIPFKDRTIGKGGAEEGVYYAFIDMMKRLEKEAVEKGEYEKAILWRDAIYKLENKLDIYDVINAIDLLRVEIPHEEVEKTIEKYKEHYRKIRGGQPEQRGA